MFSNDKFVTKKHTVKFANRLEENFTSIDTQRAQRFSYFAVNRDASLP